ncbi:MAG: glutamyl-tRNA reductase, partial [Desulfomonilia bacterium]
MNRLGCLSINHRSAPVEIREKVVLSPQDFRSLCSRGEEVYALTTCNRTEVYWIGIDEHALLKHMAWLSGVS